MVINMQLECNLFKKYIYSVSENKCMCPELVPRFFGILWARGKQNLVTMP
jgi:hypothetical protein